MTRITAIVPDPGGSGAVRIEVDGARFGTVPAELVMAEGLTAGGTLSEGQAARLSAAADVEAAYRAALDALRRRGYTRVELGRRLEDAQRPARRHQIESRLRSLPYNLRGIRDQAD